MGRGARRRRCPSAAAAQADLITLETRPLRPGQFELLTRATPPSAVTGGDVLMEVRGLRPGDRLRVRANGRRFRFARVAPACAAGW